MIINKAGGLVYNKVSLVFMVCYFALWCRTLQAAQSWMRMIFYVWRPLFTVNFCNFAYFTCFCVVQVCMPSVRVVCTHSPVRLTLRQQRQVFVVFVVIVCLLFLCCFVCFFTSNHAPGPGQSAASVISNVGIISLEARVCCFACVLCLFSYAHMRTSQTKNKPQTGFSLAMLSSADGREVFDDRGTHTHVSRQSVTASVSVVHWLWCVFVCLCFVCVWLSFVDCCVQCWRIRFLSWICLFVVSFSTKTFCV